MFILLQGVGPSTGPEPIKKPEIEQEDADEKPSYSLPPSKPDSFAKLDENERQSPFPQLVSFRGSSEEEKRENYVRANLLSRVDTGDLPDDQANSVLQKLSQQGDAPGSSGKITLMKSGNKWSTARGERVQQFLQELNMDSDELKEFLEVRSRQNQESQELERVFIAMSFGVSNPAGAVSSLKNLLGALQSPAAISLASGAIGSIASYGFEQAQKEAATKGDSSSARAMLNALKGAVVGACRDCNCNDEALGGIPQQNGGEPSVVATVTSTVEEVLAVNEDGDIVGVFYEYGESVEYENCDVVRGGAESAISSTTQSATSNFIDAQKTANDRKKELEIASTIKNDVSGLERQRQATKDPIEQRRITSQISASQVSGRRPLGLA